MTKANALLVLFDELHRVLQRPLRVTDLYLFSREVLVRRGISPELAADVRRLDASTIFLLLEQLREDGLLASGGSSFTLTEAGEARARKLLLEHPEAVVEDELEHAASAVA